MKGMTKALLKRRLGIKVFSRNKVYQDLSFGAGSLILGHNNLIQKMFNLQKR